MTLIPANTEEWNGGVGEVSKAETRDVWILKPPSPHLRPTPHSLPAIPALHTSPLTTADMGYDSALLLPSSHPELIYPRSFTPYQRRAGWAKEGKHKEDKERGQGEGPIWMAIKENGAGSEEKWAPFMGLLTPPTPSPLKGSACTGLMS
ncbi:hypothetical protein BDK51DRAFT_26984 [Blyttiomyces helicus]|uniref:Uncharacterized protein n=1 Tax=Blyttiomyces helicus TaxID=388810 RepID=A0A4P9WRH2_9FUNG|nr:hypothetical protein BDK51DRAFT_26984 [Blyttiomyces helicus]|eukprot:RKO93516.1 hypothetical protein BDK51DRAFT_26984 [Blyttiomyces helicus]